MAVRKKAPHDLPPEEQLIAKIEEVRAERRRLVKLPNTATAVGGTHKLESELLKELRQIREPKAVAPTNPVADLTDDELLGAWVAAAATVPDEAIERMLGAIELRRTGKPSLRVVDGS
jgi:hypothetical protein